MKTINTLLLAILFTLATTTIVAQNWRLVWQDEFNNSISPDWVFETGRGHSGWGNNELQYYRRENATVENGQLIITAKRENFGGANYTSARMKTQGRRTFKYGKIEARIAVPHGQGLWPAFWMLGSNINSVGWPACGEIDIMEHINNAADIHGTIHWQDHNNLYASYGGNTYVNSSNYHIYAVEWDDQSIKWFVDGNQYHEASIRNGVNGTHEFHNEHFLILNMAVGGNWPGFSVDQSRLPARMAVDYVRVYQKDGGNGSPSVATIYKHCWYGGYAVGLPEGSYTRSQLIASGIQDDDISSLKVQPGYQVTLYFHDNFTGNFIVKTSDTECLVADGFNDQVTSLRVSKTSSSGSSQTIEAENYSSMSGVQNENCSEGGQNVGYIDTGDWMAYANINFPSSGNYRIEYRVASAFGGGILSADINSGTTVLGQVNIPNTGGWQNWTTVSHTVSVTSGTHAFGVYAISGGWNINWIKITSLGNGNPLGRHVTTLEKKMPVVYPTLAHDYIHIKDLGKKNSISIYNLNGVQVLETKATHTEVTEMDITPLKPGIYIYKINIDGKTHSGKIVKQ